MSASAVQWAGRRPGRWITAPRLLALYAAVLSIFLLAPLAAAVVLSFSSISKLDFPPPGYSLRWYVEAARNAQFTAGLWTSLGIAAAATVLATLAGTLAAIALNHYRFSGRGIIQILIILPLALPGVILGLGMLFALPKLGLMPGVPATILGHAVLGIPYVSFLVLSSLSSYDLTLEQASLNLGASRWRTFTRITLPIIRPGITAGAVFAFLISFDQISVSLFIARGDTLPLRLLQHIQYYNDPSVAAVSTVLVAAALVVLLVFGRELRRRQLSAWKSENETVA